MAELTLDQSSFVPFSHIAAGHEGISSNSAGTIVIKPCTQAEIDFYTLCSTDPAHHSFYAHMPHFFGSLKSSPNQAELKKLFDGAANDGVAGPPPASQAELADAPPNTAALTPSHTQPHPQAERWVVAEMANGSLNENEAWQPSGGKKLSTGLMIAISNAAAGITRPCVMDVKLGARLWDDDAPAEKRKQLDGVAGATTSGSLGFRVAGMKVWVDDEREEQQEEHVEVEDGYKTYDKHYGRAFTQETVRGAFETFLGGTVEAEGGKRRLKRKHVQLILARLVRELESIEFTLENEESRMYSASILMVYEGDDEALERTLQAETKETNGVDGELQVEEDYEEDVDGEDDDEEAEPKIHDVCLIDFAHARFTPGEGPDENALRGVRSVLQILRSLS